MIGSAFAKAKRAFESSFQEPGKAINEKVRLYAQVGQALIEAKVAGGDPFEAIEGLMTWEQFTQSVSEAATLAPGQDPGKHAAGTNVSRKSLRWDWRLEANLKSQGKWLGRWRDLSVGLYVPLLEFNQKHKRSGLITSIVSGPNYFEHKQVLRQRLNENTVALEWCLKAGGNRL
jgi:hypothetical protein